MTTTIITDRATRRGTILRDTNAGPGMLHVDGARHTFTLEQHWLGDAAPQVRMMVDVRFDEQGQVEAVTPAQIGKEELDKARKIARQAIESGTPALAGVSARIGIPVLAAVALLAVSWIWLPFLKVTVVAGMHQSATLFEVLRLANSGASLQSFGQAGGSSGLYGLLCGLAMLAPLAPAFIAQRKAALLYLAPLAFLLCIALGIYLKVRSMADDMRDFAGPQANAMVDAMIAQIGNALSTGIGAWVSLVAALYLAWRGVQRLVLSR